MLPFCGWVGLCCCHREARVTRLDLEAFNYFKAGLWRLALALTVPLHAVDELAAQVVSRMSIEPRPS